MKVSENSSLDLEHGYACKAAIDYGIDFAQLDASLALTPLERLILHDQALALIIAARDAGIQHYGFDPGPVEAFERG
jgi:hypothetical protein